MVDHTEFTFKDVVTLKPVTIFFIVIAVACCCGAAYYAVMGVNFKLSFMMITFALIVVFTTLLLKLFASPVKILFDSEAVEIITGKKSSRYLKKDISGLYSIDYDTSRSSKIAFEILLFNGEKIHLSDIGFGDKKDESENKVLKNFLHVFCKELNFSKQPKPQSLNIGYFGKSFYAKSINN